METPLTPEGEVQQSRFYTWKVPGFFASFPTTNINTWHIWTQHTEKLVASVYFPHAVVQFEKVKLMPNDLRALDELIRIISIEWDEHHKTFVPFVSGIQPKI